MKNKDTVTLTVNEYDWWCPKCHNYNFVRASEAFDDFSPKNVICDTCESEYEAELNK